MGKTYETFLTTVKVIRHEKNTFPFKAVIKTFQLINSLHPFRISIINSIVLPWFFKLNMAVLTLSISFFAFGFIVNQVHSVSFEVISLPHVDVVSNLLINVSSDSSLLISSKCRFQLSNFGIRLKTCIVVYDVMTGDTHLKHEVTRSNG